MTRHRPPGFVAAALLAALVLAAAWGAADAASSLPELSPPPASARFT